MNARRTTLALMIAAAYAGGAQADLIFSEYIEGSSFNKAIELQNTGDATIDLSQYSVELYSNGNTSLNTALTLGGTLGAGDVYVIANSQATQEILDVTDTTSGVANFNGNDVVLLREVDTVVDRIGQLGSADTFGANVTLVRKTEITQGDANFADAFDPTEQWDSFASNTFAYLGNGGTGDDGGPDDPVLAQCGEPMTLISSVQGSGDASPLLGQNVSVEAIVVADYQAGNQLSGFFLQEEDSEQDGDPGTSEGIFVFYDDTDVAVGDRVVVNGAVDEYFGLTQINDVDGISVCASNQLLPSPALVSLPLDNADDLEAFEGMRVTSNQTLTVNEVYQLGRYGEFTVSQGRRYIPTEVAAPGPDAFAVNEANDLNKLIVEDGIRTQNPDPMRFPSPELSAYNTLRIGETLNNLSGVLNYSFGAYKLIPTGDLQLQGTNPRKAAPEDTLDRDMRVASFNVLNYYNGDGLGGGFPTDRGADTPLELERQEAKLIAALSALDADVIGLMEIENDGFDENSAIAQLVDALNVTQPADKLYDYISTGGPGIGTDSIAVGLIYRAGIVAPVNGAQVLSSDNSPLDDEGQPLFNDQKNRPALTQSFEHLGSGDRFTVVVNHLKSKGSSCDDVGDPEDPNLQGNCNGVRTAAATALAEWLSTNPTGVADADVMIIGDLNAYSMEDPLQVLADAGYANLKGDGEYSYVFDGESGNLDHALASASLQAKVINVQDWHINTDEPLVLDYNTEFKSDNHVELLYAPTPYRSSDHDPVIVDFNLNTPPNVSFSVFRFLFWYVFISDSRDDDGYLVAEDWNAGQFAFSGDWKIIPAYLFKRNQIREVTLTVTDNDGATSSLTQTLPR
ncbi:ExeM/NucH family extracellular endonuclease [Saccharospirillum impatiens]|uniref:ExeM/NucH family extracellular endonuclease n=1 Tax=Saccharospirillum impatiens TaxID=169438 RepID=UPI0004167D9B|nr:ExeM/NucH family extracellular endonuclease [Saccharospirillum impatiens]